MLLKLSPAVACCCAARKHIMLTVSCLPAINIFGRLFTIQKVAVSGLNCHLRLHDRETKVVVDPAIGYFLLILVFCCCGSDEYCRGDDMAAKRQDVRCQSSEMNVDDDRVDEDGEEEQAEEEEDHDEEEGEVQTGKKKSSSEDKIAAAGKQQRRSVYQ